MKVETAIEYLDHMCKMQKMQNLILKQNEVNPLFESIECLISYSKKYRIDELKKVLS